jgi:hypothetical protein
MVSYPGGKPSGRGKPETPATLRTRRLLAHWRGKAGDLSRAVAEFEDLVADHLRLLGPENPDTLAAATNRLTGGGRSRQSDSPAAQHDHNSRNATHSYSQAVA